MRSWLNFELEEQAGLCQVGQVGRGVPGRGLSRETLACEKGPRESGSERKPRSMWRRPGKVQCGLCSLFLFFCLFWIEYFYDSIWVFAYLSYLHLTCLILLCLWVFEDTARGHYNCLDVLAYEFYHLCHFWVGFH